MWILEGNIKNNWIFITMLPVLKVVELSSRKLIIQCQRWFANGKPTFPFLPCRTPFPGVTWPVLKCRTQRRLRGTSGPITPVCSRKRLWGAFLATLPRPWPPSPMSLSPAAKRVVLSLRRAPLPPWAPSMRLNPPRARLAGGGKRKGGRRPLRVTGSEPPSWKTCRWTLRRKRPQSLSHSHLHESVLFGCCHLVKFKHKCRGGFLF